MPNQKDSLIFEIELTEEQKSKILKETGIDLQKLNNLKLTGKDLKELISKHDPDKHDQTVGASQVV